MNLELIAKVFLSTICQVRKHIPLCLPFKVTKVFFEMKKIMHTHNSIHVSTLHTFYWRYPAFSWVWPLKPMFIFCLVMFSLS